MYKIKKFKRILANYIKNLYNTLANIKMKGAIHYDEFNNNRQRLKSY